ncbi:hypothetical protein HS048_23205 [Planomonospora sp. ID91781]|uniref:hypothetical protein n=1 Tax=Planomonospora sp. ID91781 TaxID=2738135 RepID=UPI0018C42390|nr:hypothetical protein [Planomonospora sp. ID91781]MBG0823631.1 hypothetical protein [Planomonospora sp. ID91781]
MRSRSGDHPVVSSVGWWRRWASWAGHAERGAAAAYGCVLLVAALTGYRSFLGVTDLGLPDVTWPGAAVLLVGSVVAAATVRPWGARVPPRVVSGRKHPAPHAAPRVVRRIAYAGCWVFLPYLALHALGAAGVPGIEPGGFRPTWPMVLAGVGGVGLAVFLLLDWSGRGAWSSPAGRRGWRAGGCPGSCRWHRSGCSRRP